MSMRFVGGGDLKNCGCAFIRSTERIDSSHIINAKTIGSCHQALYTVQRRGNGDRAEEGPLQL